MPSSRIDHWSNHAHQWQRVGPPLRPHASDVQIAAQMVEQTWQGLDQAPMDVVLLGVTPELASMPWPAGTQLLAVDRSKVMIEQVLPHHPDVKLGSHCGNWLGLPKEDGSAACVIGDGCFTVLEDSQSHRALCREVSRVLNARGRFIIRLFVQAEERESADQVFGDLMAGRIGNFHVFKWRLAMALHESPESGVKVRDIWAKWQQFGLTAEQARAVTGWAKEEVSTIEVYRETSATYTFPTLTEARRLLAENFVELACHTPAYELGDRCPTLMLGKRL